MKITSWNCNMAFRKKADLVISERPDILIIQECENRDRLLFSSYMEKETDFFWYGDNPNKGIAVVSFGDFKIKPLEIHNPKFKYILPLSVYNDKIALTIFAVWAQKPDNHDCYTEQVWNAVNFYDTLLRNDKLIIVGDFNSSSIWDRPNRVYNHTNLVKLLESKNIISAYHHFYKQKQGQEEHPTFFMHRKYERPYHIDFCFASSPLISKLISVEAGSYDIWTKYSDHVPLTVCFDLY